jgi:GNAT superfamily N-acetyltransferase
MTDPPAFRPVTADDLPWIVARHRALYAATDGFDDSFGTLVAQILDDWFPTHDPRTERGFVVEGAGRRLGTIFCVRLDAETAKLRLFLIEPEARGQGLGQRMLDRCMAFARDAGYRRMTLWTHESHAAACALYRKAGFTLVSSVPVHSFGQPLVEQHWQIAL